jgi:hypothetical protein
LAITSKIRSLRLPANLTGGALAQLFTPWALNSDHNARSSQVPSEVRLRDDSGVVDHSKIRLSRHGLLRIEGRYYTAAQMTAQMPIRKVVLCV